MVGTCAAVVRSSSSSVHCFKNGPNNLVAKTWLQECGQSSITCLSVELWTVKTACHYVESWAWQIISYTVDYMCHWFTAVW